jgi:hypothetical protein
MSVTEVGPPSKKLCSRSVGHSEEGCLFAGKTGSETPRPLASAAWNKKGLIELISGESPFKETISREENSGMDVLIFYKIIGLKIFDCFLSFR